MALKGLSIPICADYTHDGNGVVTYANPYVANHAVEYSVEIESGDDNNHYADNKIQEQAAGTFSSGTLTLTTSDLPPELLAKMIGLKTVKREIDGVEVDEVVHDDDANAPYLGFGIIEERQVDNVTYYKPIVLTKVRFKDPNLAGTTREDSIDWQTSEIEATVLRSDQKDADYKNPWQISPKEMYTTEDDAKNYIMKVLGEA